MHDFRKHKVWHLSRQLVVAVTESVRIFPRSDRGVLAAQLRRAALSISSNIAEGCGKSSRRETIRYLQIASGSAKETESHVMIAGDLGYLAAPARDSLIATIKSIQRMLMGLTNNLPESGPEFS
jgi:four helix bundle protein